MERRQRGERLRLFTALTIPEDVLDAIERWWTTARHALPRHRWRLVPRENWHLTLAFHGEIDGGLLGDLEQALSMELAGQPPLTLTSRGLGTFPGPERPRVFWLGIDGPGLEALARRCRRAGTRLVTGGPRQRDDEHPFRAHLTLARTRPDQRFDPRCLLDMPPPPSLQWVAGTVDLYRSRLRAEGAQYTVLTRYLLDSATSPAGRDR